MSQRIATLLLVLTVCGARPAAAEIVAPPVSLDYRASYPASLYWLINALAGDPHTNTAAYRAFWVKEGLQQAGDAPMWTRFAALREVYRGSYLKVSERENGFLPVPPPDGADLSRRFAQVFLTSDTMAEAWAKADILLTEDDLAELKVVFAHFAPRFVPRWKQLTYLDSYRRDFASYATSQRLDASLSRAARFYGVPTDKSLAVRVNFVFTPPAANTHGRQLGPDLVVEVVPGDTPKRRIDVVAHEICHYFYERARIQDDPRLYQAFFGQASPQAGPAIALLDEATATAIGQGVVAKQALGAEFAKSLVKPGSWYSDDRIDPFAKAFFPAIEQGMAKEQTLIALAPAALAAYDQAFGRQPETLMTHLANYVLVATHPRGTFLRPYFNLAPPRSLWRSGPAEAPAMLKSYSALPAVIALTHGELAAVEKTPAAYGLAGVDWPTVRAAHSGVFMARRPTAGWVFLVVGRDEAELGKALVRFAKIDTPTVGWQTL